MTDVQQHPGHPGPSAPDHLGELRAIDAQLDRLFARRAWVVQQLQAAHRGAPLPGLSGAAPAASGSGVQGLLLTTGAILLGLAGMFFAAVAWTLVGPAGRSLILLVLGGGIGALALGIRSRLPGAAEALAAVSATLLATTGWATPALWQLDWSGTGVAAWTAAVSTALAAGFAALGLLSRLRAWGVAATVLAVVAVLAAGTTAALLADDVLALTATTALIAVLVALARPLVAEPAAWVVVLVTAAGTSVLSLGTWFLDPDRVLPYAGALLVWALLAGLAGLLTRGAVSADVSRTAAAVLGAGAVALVVGTQPWGTPSLPLVALAAVLVVAASHLRAVPALPSYAAAGTLAVAAVLVPVVDGGTPTDGRWVGYLALAAVALAAAGASTGRATDTATRGLLWWSAGAAASAAWLVQVDGALDGPIEQTVLPIGALLLVAGLGWSATVHRETRTWLPTGATLLPGLLVALVPGALASLSLTWDAGWSEALLRSVVYTAIGAVLAVLGAQLRVAGLLVAGEVLLAVCVLAHLSAAMQAVPQWLVLASAGALLLLVGARWEWLRTRGTTALGWSGRLR